MVLEERHRPKYEIMCVIRTQKQVTVSYPEICLHVKSKYIPIQSYVIVKIRLFLFISNPFFLLFEPTLRIPNSYKKLL